MKNQGSKKDQLGSGLFRRVRVFTSVDDYKNVMVSAGNSLYFETSSIVSVFQVSYNTEAWTLLEKEFLPSSGDFLIAIHRATLFLFFENL